MMGSASCCPRGKMACQQIKFCSQIFGGSDISLIGPLQDAILVSIIGRVKIADRLEILRRKSITVHNRSQQSNTAVGNIIVGG